MKIKKIVSSILALSMSLCMFVAPSSAVSSRNIDTNSVVSSTKKENAEKISTKPSRIKRFGKFLADISILTAISLSVDFTFELVGKTVSSLIRKEPLSRDLIINAVKDMKIRRAIDSATTSYMAYRLNRN